MCSVLLTIPQEPCTIDKVRRLYCNDYQSRGLNKCRQFPKKSLNTFRSLSALVFCYFIFFPCCAVRNATFWFPSGNWRTSLVLILLHCCVNWILKLSRLQTFFWRLIHFNKFSQCLNKNISIAECTFWCKVCFVSDILFNLIYLLLLALMMHPPHTAASALKALVKHFLSRVTVIVTLIHEYNSELSVMQMTKIKLFGAYVVVCLHVFLTLTGNWYRSHSLGISALVVLSAALCSEALLWSKIVKSPVWREYPSNSGIDALKWVHVPSQWQCLLSKCWWNRLVAVCTGLVEYIQEVCKLRQVLEIGHIFRREV